MHIRSYALIQQTTPDDLVEKVTHMLTQGYQPLGGISVAVEGSPAVEQSANTPRVKGPKPKIIYTQAMIRVLTAADAMGQVIAKVNGS